MVYYETIIKAKSLLRFWFFQTRSLSTGSVPRVEKIRNGAKSPCDERLACLRKKTYLPEPCSDSVCSRRIKIKNCKQINKDNSRSVFQEWSVLHV